MTKKRRNEMMVEETKASVVIDAGAAEAAYISAVRAENERITLETGVRPTVYVETFGCQQNEADSERLTGMAVAMGYAVQNAPEGASLILVNTCAVREHAEKRALSFIGQYKHLKERDPSLLIGVGGCMVSQKHRVEQIKRSYPYVDFVFGTSSFYRLPEFVAKRRGGSKRLFLYDAEHVVPEGLPVVRGSDYRAWVSIMYGCNNFCTYCIVPYTRGRERSRDRADIVREVRQLVEEGYKDITLLGQNV
ncbi:MAG: radical SAM protein, partial [Clostridia bacterium]|nr:radical SAM protein [Clostridia bacterium]